MIDLHAHVLPAIDDGAPDASVMQALLKMLHDQGVTHVCCTPHFYSDEDNLTDFLDRRAESVKTLKAQGAGLAIQPVIGAEVYFSDQLFEVGDISPLCIANSQYILLELPFIPKWDPFLINMLDRFIVQFKVRPIIAHVEIYPHIQKNPDMVYELIGRGCALQMNADSLLDRATRKFAMNLMGNDVIHLLGSDCHNLKNRKPRLGEAMHFLQTHFGPELPKMLHQNAQCVLANKPIPLSIGGNTPYSLFEPMD